MTGGQAILGVSWATVSVATALVSLRLYSRATRKTLSWDDYTILVALVSCADSLIETILTVQY